MVVCTKFIWSSFKGIVILWYDFVDNTDYGYHAHSVIDEVLLFSANDYPFEIVLLILLKDVEW